MGKSEFVGSRLQRVARKINPLTECVTDDECARYHTPEGVVCEKRSFHLGCKEPWVFKHKCKDLRRATTETGDHRDLRRSHYWPSGGP